MYFFIYAARFPLVVVVVKSKTNHFSRSDRGKGAERRGKPDKGGVTRGKVEAAAVPVCTHPSIWRKLAARRCTRLVRVFVPRPFRLRYVRVS